jgi:hypothetical protein
MGRTSSLLSLLLAANCALGQDFEATKKWKGETRIENGVEYECKCYSDNACWPKEKDWSSLNKTVGGSLRVALPPGAVCYNSLQGVPGSTYDAAACQEVQANWVNEQYL